MLVEYKGILSIAFELPVGISENEFETDKEVEAYHNLYIDNTENSENCTLEISQICSEIGGDIDLIIINAFDDYKNDDKEIELYWMSDFEVDVHNVDVTKIENPEKIVQDIADEIEEFIQSAIKEMKDETPVEEV